MDELQDHVDDVIFVDAVQNTIPRPTKMWEMPGLEEVDNYINNPVNKEKILSIEGLCSNCLGFYLYTRFLKEVGKRLKAEFLRDVVMYKKSPSHMKAGIALTMKAKYLVPPGDRKTVTNTVPEGIMFLTRSVPGNLHHTFNWEEYIVSDVANFGEGEVNHITVCGEVLTTVLDAIAGMQEQEHPSNELFDEVEYVVFSSLKQGHSDSFKASSYYTEYINFMVLSTKPLTIDDFTLFRVLGRGGFGVVNGCKHSHTGKLYAMKVMDRKRIKAMRAETLLLAERATMMMLDSPFIVGLKYAFATPEELFLILDLMLGGDLGYMLYRRGPFNSVEVKYYAARTLLGLKALHDLGIVFRDLKPENILMDQKGRTRLSDLGLAVTVSRKGITGTCGSRGYWAPEMLRRNEDGSKVRYRLCVDWFSFGCVLYEFITGVCPFRTVMAKQWNGLTPKEKAIDTAILEMDPVFTVDQFPPAAEDLCSRLLDKNENTRLGAHGPEEVMAHPFFENIDWLAHMNDLVEPPYSPRSDLNVASQNEIGAFNDKKATDVQLTPLDLETFQDWDYIRTSSFLEEIVDFKYAEEKHGPISILVPGSVCCNIM